MALPDQVALITIMHTGRTSMMAKLAEVGYAEAPLGRRIINAAGEIVPYRVCFCMHPDHPLVRADLHRQFTIITMLRDARATQESWNRRDTAGNQPGTTYGRQNSEWQRNVRPFADYIVDLDDPDPTLIEMGLTPGLPWLNRTSG